MNALNSSLEMVAVVFLIASVIYLLRMVGVTKDAKILAVHNPKMVILMLTASFSSLLLSSLAGLVNGLFIAVPYLSEIQLILIILTAFFSVVAIYNGLYFYRTSPEKVLSKIQKEAKSSD